MGAGGLGVLVSVSGIGAMVGSLVLASLPNKRRGAMLLVGGGILGLALTGFAFSTSFPLSLVMILFVGLGSRRGWPWGTPCSCTTSLPNTEAG